MEPELPSEVEPTIHPPTSPINSAAQEVAALRCVKISMLSRRVSLDVTTEKRKT